jgi:hypothetical protein
MGSTIYILSNRQYFEANLIPSVKDHSGSLRNVGINVTRIAENHAIALSGIVTLLESLGMDDISFNALTVYTANRAKNKVDTAKTDSHLADYFFDSIASLNSTDGVAINLDNELVIHLPRALIKLQELGNGVSNKSELISELKRHDRYITVKTTRCFVDRCEAYHFKT